MAIYLLGEIETEIHISGRWFLKGKAAIKSVTLSDKQAIEKAGFGFRLANIPISRQKLLQSFLIVGVQGGGKTVAINSLLKQSIDLKYKNFIFDLTKYDFTRLVTNCLIISPTDARSAHWWLGGDDPFGRVAHKIY